MTNKPTNPVCLYPTKEQAARIAALTIDALLGCQVHGDANDEIYVYIDMIPIDSSTQPRTEHYYQIYVYIDMIPIDSSTQPRTEHYYQIYADGSYTRTL